MLTEKYISKVLLNKLKYNPIINMKVNVAAKIKTRVI